MEVEEDSQHLATVDVGDNRSILPSQHVQLEDVNSESVDLGDISEKKIGEKLHSLKNWECLKLRFPGHVHLLMQCLEVLRLTG